MRRSAARRRDAACRGGMSCKGMYSTAVSRNRMANDLTAGGGRANVVCGFRTFYSLSFSSFSAGGLFMEALLPSPSQPLSFQTKYASRKSFDERVFGKSRTRVVTVVRFRKRNGRKKTENQEKWRACMLGLSVPNQPFLQNRHLCQLTQEITVDELCGKALRE